MWKGAGGAFSMRKLKKKTKFPTWKYPKIETSYQKSRNRAPATPQARAAGYHHYKKTKTTMVHPVVYLGEQPACCGGNAAGVCAFDTQNANICELVYLKGLTWQEASKRSTTIDKKWTTAEIAKLYSQLEIYAHVEDLKKLIKEEPQQQQLSTIEEIEEIEEEFEEEEPQPEQTQPDEQPQPQPQPQQEIMEEEDEGLLQHRRQGRRRRSIRYRAKLTRDRNDYTKLWTGLLVPRIRKEFLGFIELEFKGKRPDYMEKSEIRRTMAAIRKVAVLVKKPLA